tara:strand:- start:552 stop:1610 length:1059 start_codon:yes stop_codon:yes gene_type:complete
MATLYIQEKGYQLIRSLMGQFNQFMTNDYETTVHAGQAMITRLKIPSLYNNYSRYLDALNINRSVFSLNFKSPITFAAFESHLDSLQFWLDLGCGGGCFKTIRLEKSVGNPRPRLQKVSLNGKEHLINALGLPGPGVNGLIDMINKHQIINDTRPLGFSIGGHTLNEYKRVCEILIPFATNKIAQTYFEINISCPNTDTGRSLHDNIDDLDDLIGFVRQKTDHVIAIKVSPDATDKNLCDIAKLATNYNNVTLNAGNTQLKSTSDVGLNNTAISIGKGGLSGPSLFKRTLQMVKLLQQFKLPIIATGGVSTADQVLAVLNEGAAIVGMATQVAKNPYSVKRMNLTLAKHLNN